MGKTYKTDPYLVRAYRHQGEKPPPDWRERWHYRNSPRWSNWAEWNAWYDSRPVVPDWAGVPRDYKLDKRNLHKKIRMAEREAIAHERYDMMPTRLDEVDFDWW